MRLVMYPVGIVEVCPMSTTVTGSDSSKNIIPDETSEEEMMRALVATISAYIEHYHGGAVEMVDFKDSVLTVKMSGACDGCELAPVTLHGWVEGTVKQFFPDLDRVVAA